MRGRAIVTFSLFLMGCSSKTFIALSDNNSRHNAIIIKTAKGSTILNRVGSFIILNSKDELPTKIGYIEPSKLKNRYALLYKNIPPKPRSYIVYFKPNSIELTKESKKILLEALQEIKKSSPCVVDIIGHTDTTGSSSANIQLSLNRAKYIKSIINKNIHSKILKITTKGYGEDRLFVKTADNIPEPKNRNVEIFIK